MAGHAEPPDPDEVMRLPAPVLERLEREVVAVAQSPERRLELLVDLISSQSGLGLRYKAMPTLSVAQTIERRHGNCLSFSLLFISMARALDLDVFPREVRVPASWRQEGRLIFDIGHVNSGVDTPSSRKTVDFEPDFLLAQRLASPYRGRRISDQRALAHFYNNRAAELLADGDTDQARAWADRALEMDPRFGPAHNTAGIIERRQARTRAAREHFRAALELSHDPAAALFNLVRLERSDGRMDEAARYAGRLEALRSTDPWFQWAIGRFYEALEEPAVAARFYTRAVDLDADEYRFHLSLARMLFELGEPAPASRALTRAVRKAPEQGDSALDSKLGKLKQLSSGSGTAW